LDQRLGRFYRRADANGSLRKLLGYVHACVIEDACAQTPIRRQDVDNGLIIDPTVRPKINRTITTLITHANDPTIAIADPEGSKSATSRPAQQLTTT
jgi:hypothetical protein